MIFNHCGTIATSVKIVVDIPLRRAYYLIMARKTAKEINETICRTASASAAIPMQAGLTVAAGPAPDSKPMKRQGKKCNPYRHFHHDYEVFFPSDGDRDMHTVHEWTAAGTRPSAWSVYYETSQSAGQWVLRVMFGYFVDAA